MIIIAKTIKYNYNRSIARSSSADRHEIAIKLKSITTEYITQRIELLSSVPIV